MLFFLLFVCPYLVLFTVNSTVFYHLTETPFVLCRSTLTFKALKSKVIRLRSLSLYHLHTFLAKCRLKESAFLALLSLPVPNAFRTKVLLNANFDNEFVSCKLKEEELSVYPLDLFTRKKEASPYAITEIKECS